MDCAKFLITGVEFGVNPEFLRKKREKGEMNLPKKLPISCTLKICELLFFFDKCSLDSFSVGNIHP